VKATLHKRRYETGVVVATAEMRSLAIIEARLAAYPQLSAVRLLAEIRAAGYERRARPEVATN